MIIYISHTWTSGDYEYNGVALCASWVEYATARLREALQEEYPDDTIEIDFQAQHISGYSGALRVEIEPEETDSGRTLPRPGDLRWWVEGTLDLLSEAWDALPETQALFREGEE